MRQVSKLIADAFMQGNAKSSGNTKTDGRMITLFGNRIAEWREDGLYISNCGWRSRTTKDRLNALPCVNIYQSGGKWYLNSSDEEWDGNWTKVSDAMPPAYDAKKVGKKFDTSKKWVSSDGWRGYEEPVYAVAGANDTGMWSDSPCRSDVADNELQGVQDYLKANKIPSKRMTCETSNVFCVHHYLIVPPAYIDNARELVEEYYDNTKTSLLYQTK